jgi:hypothetical protein
VFLNRTFCRMLFSGIVAIWVMFKFWSAGLRFRL